MKHSKISILLICILLAIVSSCTVQSLFPLFTADDLVYDPNVIGTWDINDNQTWKFERKLEEKDSIAGLAPHYELTVIEYGEKAVFDAHLLHLGDYYYFNFYLKEFEMENNMALSNLLPVNTFARTQIYTDSLNIEFFNFDFLSNLIKEKKIRIKHVITKEDERLLLTAPTEELQKYVIKYEDNTELVDNEVMLYRHK